MSWIKINSKRDLPNEGEYVFARHTRGTWHDSRDKYGDVNCVVVILVKGLSKKDRQKMIDGKLKDYDNEPTWCLSDGWKTHKRSSIYKSQDEHSNNLKPYYWDHFSSDSFFGQDISHWMPIPPVKIP